MGIWKSQQDFEPQPESEELDDMYEDWRARNGNGVKTKLPTFKKGQTVKWESQASGFKKKIGSVVAKVPAGKSFANSLNRDLCFELVRCSYDIYIERKGTTYVVRESKSGRLYCPLVKYLKLKP